MTDEIEAPPVASATIVAYDDLRRQAKDAAQLAFAQALIDGDAPGAAALFEAAQHGTLEPDVLDQFGLLEQRQVIETNAELVVSYSSIPDTPVEEPALEPGEDTE